jgi:ribosome-associated heat shock protein Hsp15
MATPQRLDKWLWMARVVKTRTLATQLVAKGTVRVNGNRITKPGKPVRVDDVLTIALSGNIRILKVLRMADRRGPFTEAQTLFEDLSPPPEHRKTKRRSSQLANPAREKGMGRPTKRDRRRLTSWRDRAGRS